MTLADLIVLVAADLQDPDYAVWSAEDHENNIRRALAYYSTLNPCREVALLDIAPGQREINIASLGALDILDVWFPYDPNAPAYPPPRIPFHLPESGALFIEGEDLPTAAPGEKMRVLYVKPHTLSGLDGATETTLDGIGIEIIALLATASAAMQRCQAAIGKVNITGWTPDQLLAWANARQSLADRACEALRQRLTIAQDARVSWER